MRAVARVIGGLAVAGIAYAGTSITDDNTTRGASGEITEAGGLGAAAVRVGDCINIPDNDGSNEVISVEGIPCNEPHDEQIYYEFVASTSGGYAGMEQQTDQKCFDNFDDFIGVAWEESTLDFYAWTPSVEGWEQGDREVSCIVFNPAGGKLLGSMEGTRR